MFKQAASLHSTRLPASFFARFSAPGTGTVTYTIDTELSCEVQLIDCGRTRVPALAKTPFNCAGTGVITCPNYLALTCRQIARPGVEPGRRQTTTLVEIASALGTSSRQHRPCQRERPEHKHTAFYRRRKNAPAVQPPQAPVPALVQRLVRFICGVAY